MQRAAAELDTAHEHTAHLAAAEPATDNQNPITAAWAQEVHEQGHRLVVRNRYHSPREVIPAAGALPVRQPRVNDKRVDENVSGYDISFANN